MSRSHFDTGATWLFRAFISALLIVILQDITRARLQIATTANDMVDVKRRLTLHELNSR